MAINSNVCLHLFTIALMTVFCSHAAEMYYCFFPVNKEEGEEKRRRKRRRCRRRKTRMRRRRRNRRKKWTRRKRRRRRLQLQCHLPQQCSRVVLMDQDNCFSSSAQGGGEGEGGGGREQQGERGRNHDNAVLRSNGTWLYLLSKTFLFSFQ